MKNKPTVSIVTITYGHEAFIEDTIKGVFDQQYNGEIEFIIANDNSPDSTDEVVRNYLAKSPTPLNITIKYTKHSENKGMMPNFFWALQQATGKYIALCEGDDYWIDPLKLQKQVDFLEQNEEYVIHSAKAQVFRDGNLEEIIGNPLNKETYTIKDFYTKNNFITCTVLFRNITANFKKINTKGLLFGDWILYTQLLDTQINSKAYVSNDIVSTYQVHSGGIMQNVKKKFDNDIAHFNQILRIKLYFNPLYSESDIKRLNDTAIFIAKQYLGKRQYMSFIKTLFQNYQLAGNRIYFKKYLFLVRYHNQIDISKEY
ncbi:glycosyltransferase family 2 protein [Elizabethkingia sp. JS20170427COW]|nr:glycosyltransferase family 2 protein [Elizabethkingia sp. JS20170427COW]